MNLGLLVAITTTLLAVAPPASSNDVDGKAGFEIMVSFYKQINRATSEEQIEEITDAVQDSSSSLTVEQGEFIFDALNERRVLLYPFNDEIIAKEFTQLCDDVK